MTVFEIIEKYLKDNGYDGLTNGDDCSCKIENLAPCCDDRFACRPGYEIKCNGCDVIFCLSEDKEATCPEVDRVITGRIYEK